MNKEANVLHLEAAKEAGLVYVSDESAGITRVKSGKGFVYKDPKGKTVKDFETLVRIKHLAIPPAWTEVWICPLERGHIQAVGRDARGRKQYRYHEKWRETRDEAKYEKMIEFAKALPSIRQRTRAHLKLPGLPKEKVLAAIVQIMEKTLIRVGNEEYAKANNSYGLTTLQDKHAKIKGGKIHFEFRGKSGVEHEIDLQDPRLAEVAKKCQDLPGQELFQYLDENGKVCDIGSADVNDYLRSIAGHAFTAKDFRTWAGTVLAAQALSEIGAFTTQKQAKTNVVQAVESVAKQLGNTKAVCRKCYIHPAILQSYLDGQLAAQLAHKARAMAKAAEKLRPEEASVLKMLERKLTKGKKAA
ncbi:MAG TPA: DNA topoisomerase IB [Tepidisphaeraceae bacterium]|jgi:DNA topoisomerase-1